MRNPALLLCWRAIRLGVGMGFYIRKSVSAGPFRFNLSGSGLGMSVGVKGFRLGTGPRGNYVHMGRGGLYYRASLGGPKRQAAQRQPHPPAPRPMARSDSIQQVIETGNVVEMVPSNGSKIVEQVNEKLASPRLWPWVLGLGIVLSIVTAGQPAVQNLAGGIFLAAIIGAAIAAYWDNQRRTVVILYDLEDTTERAFEALAKAFEQLARAQRIWNIDTAGRTNDWKRNAGASHLINRKLAQLTYKTPTVIKTNISIPAILGGRQSVYFFPDVVLVTDGKRVGAVAYEQLDVLWHDSVFLETDSVPRDAQVVGQSWQYVNKNGGPDRRFKNNRQIPRVLYQEMGLQGAGGFQKILQISLRSDRGDFDRALNGLRHVIERLQNLALEKTAIYSDALGAEERTGA